MAKKEVKSVIKLQIAGTNATPGPPIGVVLGPTGINVGDFCKKFNDATKDDKGVKFPVVLSIYADRTFDFIIKKPTASFLIRQKAGIEKGSGKNLVSRAGSLTKEQLKQIANEKMEDLNANTVEQAMRIIEGTARSMGVHIKE